MSLFFNPLKPGAYLFSCLMSLNTFSRHFSIILLNSITKFLNLGVVSKTEVNVNTQEIIFLNTYVSIYGPYTVDRFFNDD